MKDLTISTTYHYNEISTINGGMSMAVKRLPDKVADLAMERVAGLLADRVADRVVDALMKAGFDKQFADSLLKSFKDQIERT